MKEEENEVVKRLLFQIPVSQLDERVKDSRLNITYTQEAADVLAKQEAIAFADWMNDNYAEIGGCGAWCLRGEDGGETYSIPGLYDIFKNQK